MDSNTNKLIEKAHHEWMDALDVVEDPIFMHDKEFRILRCNKAYQQIAGLPFKEIIGQLYFQIFPKCDAPLQNCLEAMRTLSSKAIEEELELNNKFFRSRTYTITNENKKYLYSVHILEDITKQRIAEKQLKEVEKGFESIFNNARDGILLADIDTKKFHNANERMCKMLGYTYEELMNLGVDAIHPKEDLEFVISQFERQSRKEIELVTLPVQRKDGTVFYADINSFPIKVQGKEYMAGFFRDMTERIEYETLLKRERDFSERLIQTAPVIILTLNKQGKIVSFNNYMESLTGYTLEEVQGEEWFEYFIPKHDREKIKAIFSGAIESLETQGNRNTILTKNGDEKLVEWYDKTIKDENGNTIGLLAIGMDITQTHKTEEELKLFRLLLDHSDDMIEIIDPETLLLIDANETESKVLGYTKEEILTKYVYEIDTHLSPELSNTIEEELETKGRINFESVHTRKDGSQIPVDINLTLTQLDKPYILSIARDITERKKAQADLKSSEEMFHSITSSAQDAIIMMDEKGKISYWNHAAEKMFGYKADEIVGQLLHKLIAPERFLDAHNEAFKEYIKTGKGGCDRKNCRTCCNP